MAHPQPEDRAAQVAAFIRAVVAGKNTVEIAAAAGISQRSVYNWHRRPAIKKRIEETLSLLCDAHINAITTASPRGLRKLVKLLKSGDEKIQLGAARALVAEMGKVVELRAEAARNKPPEQPDVDETPTQIVDRLCRRVGQAMPPNGHANGEPHDGNGQAT